MKLFFFVCLFFCLTSRSTIVQSFWGGATASGVFTVRNSLNERNLQQMTSETPDLSFVLFVCLISPLIYVYRIFGFFLLNVDPLSSRKIFGGDKTGLCQLI